MDKTRVGNVFVVQRKQKLNLANPSQRLLAHTSVVIDVGGESNNTHLIGLECHLVVDEGKVASFFLKMRQRYDELLNHYYVGKIQNKFHSCHPDDWAHALQNTIHIWFTEFRSLNGMTWSSKSNCQQFARPMHFKIQSTYGSLNSEA
eukprot:TRINITY_DN22931_c0_g1_i1.p1 TRINITY_DN22931_c0_g1~~TRINITY_DN22931_c0_g1_i1.p1  ORF type:complete len:156 (-),score=12.43 TRINITY_DN22931_c0_g1_i1:170-610(-)